MFGKSLLIAAMAWVGVGAPAAGAEELLPSARHDFGWTQQGWLVAFVSDRDGDLEVYTMRVDGSEIRRLTRSPGLDVAPAISADGTQVAFVSARDGQEEIYVMNADGSGQRRLTDHPAWDFNPRFSADGREVLFDSNRSGAVERYAVSLEGRGSAGRLAGGSPVGVTVRPAVAE